MPFCEICVQRSGGSVLGMLYQENSESSSRIASLAVGTLEG